MRFNGLAAVTIVLENMDHVEAPAANRIADFRARRHHRVTTDE
jgi:hypothetical protein